MKIDDSDIDDMREELIELEYKNRDLKYDLQISEEEKEESISKLEADIERVEIFLEAEKYLKNNYSMIEELENIIRELRINIIRLEFNSDDLELRENIYGYREYNKNYIMSQYAQAMLDGKIEVNEELLKELLLNEIDFVDEFIIIKNKDILQKAIEITGDSLLISSLADENVIKEILSDVDEKKKILNKKQPSQNFLSGEEELDIIITQLIRCDELCQDKSFMIKLIDNFMNYNIGTYDNFNSIITIIAEKGNTLLLDNEFTEKLFDYIESEENSLSDENYNILCEKLLPGELSKNKELAYRYCKLFENLECVNKELRENKEFLLKILNECYFYQLELPKIVDIEVLEKYFSNVEEPDIDGINIETLNNERIAKKIEEKYGLKPNEIFLNTIAGKIENTGTIVTHFGDDLDNKAAIEAIQRWAEDNDLIKIGHPLKVIRVPAGQVKEEALNVDTGGHKGSTVKDYYTYKGETIIIDGDIENGVKSACEALSRLGIYVPEQIVELADAKTNKVSSLDSRSGLALVRYLNGEQTFKLAEAKLLDKSLSDEQLKEYGLTTAHKKQQEIIDNAITKIEKYTKELPNGEQIVLAPEQIISGSSIAYEKGINYYASASEHFNSRGIPDGITFAITSKPGIQLPEEVLEYGKKLSEIYKTGENTSDIFVNPNNQMIIAGGFKNPEFKIAGENVEGMLNKILEIFEGKNKER